MVGAPPGAGEPTFLAAVRQVLRESHAVRPSELPEVINRAASPLGVRLTVFVVDYEQRTLRAVPEDGRTNTESIAVDGSLGGLAFQTVTVQRTGRSPEVVWAPVLDGTARLGVLRAQLGGDMASADPAVVDGVLAMASLVGHLLQSKTALGDTIEAVRRTMPMTAASELVWKLAPPPTFLCDRLAIAAVLEPCYDVGGDCFDYSVDGRRVRIAVCDAVGHGMPAAVSSSVAISAMRAARRSGHHLVDCASAVDAAIVEQWSDSRFLTAVLAEMDLDDGLVRYVNAGHLPPALIRDGRAVKMLDGGRRLPLGLGDTPFGQDQESVAVAEERLQPGDRLLLYTDGVTEARNADGSLFGLPRLIDLTERHVASGLPTPEILRRLSHAVLEHQAGVLQDDATLLLVEWTTDALARDLP
jgi:phosphoserine phosphatase RsbU/P